MFVLTAKMDISQYARETAERMIRSLLNEFERSFINILKNFSEAQLKKAYNGDLELEASIFEAFQDFEEFVSQTVSKFSSGKAENKEDHQEIAEEEKMEDQSVATPKTPVEHRTPQHYRTLSHFHRGHQSHASADTTRRYSHFKSAVVTPHGGRTDETKNEGEMPPRKSQPPKIKFDSAHSGDEKH